MSCRRVVLALGLALWAASTASAQSLAARVSMLQAEDRRAPKPGDVGVLRSGSRSNDGDTARLAVRALGRLERPALIPDILGALRHKLPEVRAEAAVAVAQAAQGLKTAGTPTAPLGPAQAALIARLSIDDDADVRAAVCESLARLPYTAVADAVRAESTLLDFAGRASSVTDRLGVARALEAFVRLQSTLTAPSAATLDLLRSLVDSV